MFVLGAKTHDIFDTGAIIPAAIENDDFSGQQENAACNAA